jgi:cholesterol transport system auxiliary component
MSSKRILVPTVCVIILSSLSGCGKQQFDKQRYWLSVERSENPSRTETGAILSVQPFSIDSAFRGRSLVYQKSDHEYKSDYYQEYLIAPAQMVTEQTCRWLGDSGLFARVLQAGSIMQSTHVLEAHIGKMYVGASQRNEYLAELEISLYLLKKENREKHILFGRTYEASRPMDARTTEDYFRALERALVTILQDFEDDLARHM